MADGLRSGAESTPRRVEEPPTVKVSQGKVAVREVAADPREKGLSIKDPLGDYSEQTGAFFG